MKFCLDNWAELKCRHSKTGSTAFGTRVRFHWQSTKRTWRNAPTTRKINQWITSYKLSATCRCGKGTHVRLLCQINRSTARQGY